MKKYSCVLLLLIVLLSSVGCLGEDSSSSSSSYSPVAASPTTKLANYFVVDGQYPKLANINQNNYDKPTYYSSFGLVAGDEQIIYEAAAANTYYDGYLNAIAQGYSAADCAKTYEAHKTTAKVAIQMMKQFK